MYHGLGGFFFGAQAGCVLIKQVDLGNLFAPNWFFVSNVTETTLSGIEALSTVSPPFVWPLSGAVINIDGTVSNAPFANMSASTPAARISRRASSTGTASAAGLVQLQPLQIRTFALDVFVRPADL